MISPRMPQSYVNASLRNTTRVDPETGRIGLAFNLENDTYVRIALPLTQVAELFRSMLFMMEGQIEKSSGVSGRITKMIQEATPADEEINR